MRLRIETREAPVRTARHWVTAHVEGMDLPQDVVTVAELLTSELVGNAVVHGRDPIAVDVHLGDGVLTIEVSDEGDGLPVLRTTGPDVPGGQGVRLVEQLATRWGVEQRGAVGKTVWFAVATDAVER